MCSSVAATAAAYQQVITKYSLHAIDFDLEEPEYENTHGGQQRDRRGEDTAAEQPGLYVTVTVPGTTSGTGYFGQNVLNTAKADGFTPANFAIMPFDGGFNGAASQTAALEAFHTLLMNTFGWSTATAYNHEGVSQMNGRSDTGEFFTQTDFQTVLNYATSHGLSRYTFWAVNRDRQCTPLGQQRHHVRYVQQRAQGAWDFTKLPRSSPARRRPPPSPTTPPTTAPSGYVHRARVDRDDGVQRRRRSSPTAATSGPRSGGRRATSPATTRQAVWTDNGPCGAAATPRRPRRRRRPATPTPTPTPDAEPDRHRTGTAWVANHAYAVGAIVTYGGHTYKCLQAHTSQVGWEPPNVPALWQLVS